MLVCLSIEGLEGKIHRTPATISGKNVRFHVVFVFNQSSDSIATGGEPAVAEVRLVSCFQQFVLSKWPAPSASHRIYWSTMKATAATPQNTIVYTEETDYKVMINHWLCRVPYLRTNTHGRPQRRLETCWNRKQLMGARQEERARILGNMLPRRIPQLPKECDEKAPGPLDLAKFGVFLCLRWETNNPCVSGTACMAGQHPLNHLNLAKSAGI